MLQIDDLSTYYPDELDLPCLPFRTVPRVSVRPSRIE